MATIVDPPNYAGYEQPTYLKTEPTVQVAEAQPESVDLEDDSASEDSASLEGDNVVASIMGHKNRKHKPKKPKKPSQPVTGRPVDDRPVFGRPVDDRPVFGRPVPNPVKNHPIFEPNKSTLENVQTHMLCNDLFLNNVRNLVEDYKKMLEDNRRQARVIVGLESKVSDLQHQVRSITIERDDYKNDYETEWAEHQKTQATLSAVRSQLKDLQVKYDSTLIELRRHRALLSEAYREINRLTVEIADKNARIIELEEKLRISNASEDRANEHVTELQHAIYELERAKTAIEKEKDRAQQAQRNAEDTIKGLNYKIRDLNDQIRRLKRREMPIHIFNSEAAPAAVEDPLFEALSREQDPPLFEAQSTAQDPPLFEAQSAAPEAETEESISSPANEE